MKNIKFLLGLVTIVAIMTSCATMGSTTDDPYMNNPNAQRVGNRVYVQDPYYGTVVLERDPYTGRYYDVTYGSGYRAGYYTGNPYGAYRSYGRNGGGYYRRDAVVVQQQGPSAQEMQQHRDEVRRKVLGN